MLCLFTVQSVFAAVESSESIKETSHHINTHQMHAKNHQHADNNTNQQADIDTTLTAHSTVGASQSQHQDEHESCHAHFHFHPTMLIELTTLSPLSHNEDVLIARQLAPQKRTTSLYRPPIA